MFWHERGLNQEAQVNTVKIVAALITMPDEVMEKTLNRPLRPGESLASAMHTRCAVANLAVAPEILVDRLGCLPPIYHLRADYQRALGLNISGIMQNQDKHHVGLIVGKDGCVGFDFASAPFESMNPELGVPLIVVPRLAVTMVISRLNELYHADFRRDTNTYDIPYLSR